MQQPHTARLLRAYRLTHQRLLQLFERLDDDQLQWRPSAHTPALAFHFWHIARWADHLQAAFPGMSPTLAQRLGQSAQAWQSGNLANAWGWTSEELGYDATGMGMRDDVGAHLQFPPKAELRAYLQEVFAKVDSAIDALDDGLLLTPERPQQATDGIFSGNAICDALLVHITHDSRHLGMIEGLLGILRGKGTATV